MKHSLHAISSIDGRYRGVTESLAAYFSEAALIRHRILVEIEYFLQLAGIPELGIRALSEKEVAHARRIATSITDKDIELVSDIELKGYKGIPATNHDVKAMEYFVKLKFKESSLKDLVEWVHFGLTSEDVSNVSYALMLVGALENVMIPALEDIQNRLQGFAMKYAVLPMLARTHGQPASPTTVGKEMRVFEARLSRQLNELRAFRILVKWSGATGNYNAHVAAFSSVNWLAMSATLISRLSKGKHITFELNPITTQIEPHDTYAELFDRMRRINTILTDFCQDMWRYISDGWFAQIPKEGEVGSSTMPHKLNPWVFEKAEGNLGVSSALLEFFSRKLPVSRLQRDLTDSTIDRVFGAAFAHALVGYASIIEGLGKVLPNEERIKSDLEAHPEVITEAIQTVLRAAGVPLPYEELKALTRGKHVTMEEIHAFISKLNVSDAIKEKLLKITPSNYIGLAEKLVRDF